MVGEEGFPSRSFLFYWRANAVSAFGSCVPDLVTLGYRLVPDGWPIWTSEVHPGREHDTTAVRTHLEILPALAEAAGDLRSLGDLGYEGEADTITVAFRKPKHRTLNAIQQRFNKAHNGVRASAGLTVNSIRVWTAVWYITSRSHAIGLTTFHTCRPAVFIFEDDARPDQPSATSRQRPLSPEA